MADSQVETISDGKTVHGVVAEFSDVDSLLAACRRVRDAGYTKADAFTPFPVHGIDTALGIKPTVLPWIALCTGLCGTSIALLMQISMNGDWIEGFSYPYIISGKPFISLPAFIPVTFELSILLASFGTFFGMWALNGLPRFSNPMFTSPRFDRATDDTFFLYLDAKDDRFEEAGAKALLGDLGGQFIEPGVEDDSPSTLPKGLLIGLSLIPALAVARMRVTKSSSPRFHIFPDMDFSPAKDAQQISTLFADGRAMRPNVPGTVARGGMDWDVNFQTGIDIEKLSLIDAPRAQRLVAMQAGDDEPADEPTGEKKAEDAKPAKEAKADEPKKSVSPKKSEAEEKSNAKPADTKKPDDAKKAAAKKEKPKSEKPKDEKPAEMKKAAEEAKQDDKPKVETKTSASDKEKPKTESKPAAATLPAAAAQPAVVDNTPWLKENPLTLSTSVLERGQQQFNVYCSVCHGLDGRGKGLVHERAQKILATTWTPPSNMHDPTLHQETYPDGKLFGTITNGVRKMPGYAAQIRAEDRWSIVAYVRALQASRSASLDDVPADQRDAIREAQAKVQAALKKAAEEEAAKAKAAKATT